MHCRKYLTRLRFLSLWVAAAIPGVANCADGKPAQRGGAAVDHPLGLVAFASVDRIRARGVSLIEASGTPQDFEKLLNAVTGGDGETTKLLNSPGLDTTRPIGAMCYPNWFGETDEATDKAMASARAGAVGEKLAEDPAQFLLEGLATIFVSNATLVICIPAKDRQQLLETVRDVVSDDVSDKVGKLVEVETQPGWYQFGEDKEGVRIGFVGNYLLIVGNDGEVKNFDRNYPDFGQLAKASLGKSGFVYSLYRRGLPAIVRDGLAPAFKMAFAARFQQQDNEPEIVFRLRTMFGPLQMELVDLVLSHVDEFRITGHVDSGTRTIYVDPELIGPKDGKFARYCNSMMAKSSPFANLTSDEAAISAIVSLPLPLKSWKPVSEALYRQAEVLGKSEMAEVIRTVARTVESGQFDLFTCNPSWSEGLYAVRVAGNARFPDQFQQMIAKLSDPPMFEFAVDSVEGFPIHRTLTTVGQYPQGALLLVLLQGLLGLETDVPNLNQASVETEVQIVREEVAKDGTRKKIVETKMVTIPAEHSIWLVATPSAIWLGFGSSKNETCPECFKSQIAASLAKPAGTAANNRSKSPLQLTLRGLGASPTPDAADPDSKKPDIQPAAGTEPSKENEKERSRGDLLRDLPNAVRCELRPTETGLKLSIAFEEAYFLWFAALVKDSTEESEAATPPANAEAPDAAGK